MEKQNRFETRKSSIESFFNEYSLAKKKFYQTDGKLNRSVDASGWMPSVNEEIANRILKYVKKLLPEKKELIHLDCGTGLGYLPKVMNSEPGFLSFGIEGSAYLTEPTTYSGKPTGLHEPLGPHNGMVAPKEKILITDLCKEITDVRLKKAFDLTTSFEVIEHVDRRDQMTFWKNMTYLSDYHLCGIHIANEEHDQHCTINPPEVWDHIFTELGMDWKRLNDFPTPEWDCSVFYLLKLPESLPNKRLSFGSPQKLQVIKRILLRNEKIADFYVSTKVIGWKSAIKLKLSWPYRKLKTLIYQDSHA
jgi:hypothetical protein